MTFDKAELITDKFFTLIAAICIAAVICGSPSAEANTNSNAGLSEQASKECHCRILLLELFDGGLIIESTARLNDFLAPFRCFEFCFFKQNVQ